MIPPAQKLSGLTLDGGWKVGERFRLDQVTTGGNFSCNYELTNRHGQKAFLKALDYSLALSREDQASVLQAMLNAYLFERDILGKCAERRMDRVVQSIGFGSVVVDPSSPIGRVDYLILECADCDVRVQLSKMRKVEDSWKLRALHHIATGLHQLHSAGIAHQDLKPSNVLVFDGAKSKVSDLGSASLHGTISPRDDRDFPGDPDYAPPELLYGHLDSEWLIRRLGSDAYHLGSMIVFFFTGLSATGLLFRHMHRDHIPKQSGGNWAGTYSEALPYLREAFSRTLETFGEHVEETGLREALSELMSYLCEPDLALRGHPRNRTGHLIRLDLERFVSRLNLLAQRAEYQSKRHDRA